MSRKKGWVIPGHKWTGPGNDPYIGPLQSLTDYISRDHDIDYGAIEKKFGVNPKYYWTKADEVAIKQWSKTGEWSGAAASFVFKVKKFLNTVGVIPGLDMTKKDRIQEFAVDSTGNSKRLRFETPDQPPSKKDRGQTLDTDSKRKTRTPRTAPPQPNMTDMETDVPQAITVARSEGGQGQAGAHNNGETPLSPYDFVQIGLPNTYTTRLPYRTRTTISNPQSTTASAFGIRTNSIYDVLTDAAYTADPAATADSTSGSVEVPKWRSFFADKYRYWSVIGCDYKVMLRQKWATSTAITNSAWNFDIDCFMYKCGIQRPPLAAGGAIVPYEWKILHTGVEYKVIPGRTGTTTFTSAGVINGYETTNELRSWTVFSGHVGIGDIKHEIVEDELAQRWHRMTEVPPTPEQLVFHLQPNEFNTGETESIDVIIEVTYLVQFKDLVAQYEYPTQATAFAAIAAPV